MWNGNYNYSFATFKLIPYARLHSRSQAIISNNLHKIETAIIIPPSNSESLCLLPVGDSTRTTGMIDCFSDLHISKTGNNSCFPSESLSERSLQKQNTFLPPHAAIDRKCSSCYFQHHFISKITHIIYSTPSFSSTRKLCNINSKRCKPFLNRDNLSL